MTTGHFRVFSGHADGDFTSSNQGVSMLSLQDSCTGRADL